MRGIQCPPRHVEQLCLRVESLDAALRARVADLGFGWPPLARARARSWWANCTHAEHSASLGGPGAGVGVLSQKKSLSLSPPLSLSFSHSVSLSSVAPPLTHFFTDPSHQQSAGQVDRPHWCIAIVIWMSTPAWIEHRLNTATTPHTVTQMSMGSTTQASVFLDSALLFHCPRDCCVQRNLPCARACPLTFGRSGVGPRVHLPPPLPAVPARQSPPGSGPRVCLKNSRAHKHPPGRCGNRHRRPVRRARTGPRAPTTGGACPQRIPVGSGIHSTPEASMGGQAHMHAISRRAAGACAGACPGSCGPCKLQHCDTAGSAFPVMSS